MQNQEEALDFSLKRPVSTTQSTPNTMSPISLANPCFNHPSLEEVQKQFVDHHLSPFALLSSSGGIAIHGMTTQSSMVSNQLLPTTSLALTALQRRRRRISSSEGDDVVQKKLRTIPEERKDETYWERRRKNNEAAKRSRDARKAKEDEIAIRAAFLESENLKLRAQLNMLKGEMARLQGIFFTSQMQS